MLPGQRLAHRYRQQWRRLMERQDSQKPPNSNSVASAPRPEFALGATEVAPGSVALAFQTTHVGPLPPPAMLAAFGQIDPSFPDRIVTMAEKNAEAERSSAVKAQTYQFYDAMAGRMLGFLFGAAAIVVTLVPALNGHDAVAGVVGGTTVVGVVAALIRGKSA